MPRAMRPVDVAAPLMPLMDSAAELVRVANAVDIGEPSSALHSTHLVHPPPSPSYFQRLHMCVRLVVCHDILSSCMRA